MIKEIELINFQGHEHSTLKLSPGLNVITGPSDNGKSSIIRALKWVLQNRPQGDSICRHDTNETRVIVRTSDHVVERFRKGRENAYVVDGEIFRAMRGGVPEEVGKALGMSESSLQSQHETHFLINRPPGEAAKYLNELADLSEIDAAIKKANSLVGKAQNDKRHAEVELQKLDDKIAESANLDAIGVLVARIERAAGAQATLRAKSDTLLKILVAFDETVAQEAKANKVLEAEADIMDLRWRITQHCELEQRFTIGLQHYDALLDAQEAVDRLKVVEGADDLADLKQEVTDFINQREVCTDLMQILTNIQRLQESEQRVRGTVDSMQGELATLWADLKVCPTCGATMGQQTAPVQRRRPA